MKKAILFLVIVIALLAAVTVAIVYWPGQKMSNGKLPVTASFYPLAEFARQVGGYRVDVTTITPAGAEPHDYEPSPQDIIAMRESKLFIYNGSGVELWADKEVPELRKAGVQTLNMSSQVTLRTVKEDNAGEPGQTGASMYDPHFWLDPVVAQDEVRAIANLLSEVDPVDSSVFQSNAQQYIKKLQTLDAAYRESLASCTKHDIVTSHAAFGYLAHQYGLHQVSIAGFSPDAEPSPQQLADVAKFAKAQGITYIFFESLVSPKLSETIAQEIGAQTLVLNPLEGLSDSDIAAGQNYLTVMQSNLVNLRAALVCK